MSPPCDPQAEWEFLQCPAAGAYASEVTAIPTMQQGVLMIVPLGKFCGAKRPKDCSANKYDSTTGSSVPVSLHREANLSRDCRQGKGEVAEKRRITHKFRLLMEWLQLLLVCYKFYCQAGHCFQDTTSCTMMAPPSDLVSNLCIQVLPIV